MLQTIIKRKDPFTKLKILSQSAKYDDICISYTKIKKIKNQKGIYYASLPYGRHIPLLKVLYTNLCINNCKYCYNRRNNDIRRTCFSPKELANLVIEFYQKGYIKGLFLSSGIYPSADHTMELMIKTAEILRKKFEFKGYIHLKILPGTSKELIKKAIILADRVSCNIELPTSQSLKKIAPDKDLNSLISTLETIYRIKTETEKPISTSTQLIIGATPDSDKTILKLTTKLYKNNLVNRVYYSAYIPINKDKDLPQINVPPFMREYRLYQADFLIRFYGFNVDELFQKNENLNLNLDPKTNWALSHPDFFPVEITKADYWELIRIPGIGPSLAKKIIKIRKKEVINEEVLRNIGINIKKIAPFITVKGRTFNLSRKDLVQLDLF